MTLLAGAAWTPTDDDGTGGTGTIVNAAWVAAIKASLEANIHSATNPTVDPNDLVDEVVTARNAYGSLDARLDAMDVSIGSVPTPGAILASVGKTNLFYNELFEVWPTDDAEVPAGFALAGAAGTIARCGTGLADTNRKIGDFCAKVTRVAADTTLQQVILNAAAMTAGAPAFQSKVCGFGAWVRSTSIGGARIFINDGVGTTYSTANVAANTWEWLTVQRTLNAAATLLNAGVINDVNAASCYLSAPTVFIGDTGGAPTEWAPSPVEYVTHTFHIPGAQTTGASKIIWMPMRPAIVRNVILTLTTAPTGASFIVDVNTWDGAAFTSMFGGTKPSIAISKQYGIRQPDGTYTRRCLSPTYFDPILEGTAVSFDIDQIGSGVAGSGLTIELQVLQPSRFYESIFPYNFIA